MLKYTDYDIVFQEIPDEVTLAVNLSGCPHRCKGCHSPHLQQDIGEELNEGALSRLLQLYEHSITCICFMGGDAHAEEVCQLANHIRMGWKGKLCLFHPKSIPVFQSKSIPFKINLQTCFVSIAILAVPPK